MEPSDLLDAYHSRGETDLDVVIDDPVFDDPAFGDPTFADPSGGAFGGLFALITVLIVVGVVASVLMSLRRARKLRDAGIDPLDPTTDLQIRYMQRTGGMPPRSRPAPGPAPAAPTAGPGPPSSVADRLAEVDRLYEAGTITTAERDAARARVLGSI